jgi:long-chain acyl-CoA synthetase
MEFMDKVSGSEDTLPKILASNYRKYGDRKIAMRKKDLGIWNEYTWKDVYEHVKWVSLGLISLGFRPGENVVIVGDNDPQWYWAEYAAQAALGTATGAFVDAHYSELQYLVDHSDARFVFAKDQEQVDKLLEVRGQIPRVEKVIYWEHKGVMYYRDPWLMSYEDLEALGKDYEKSHHPGLFEQNISHGKGSDVAVLCYTSGTTGAAQKGVMMTHNQLIRNCEKWFAIDPWRETDDYLTYVPPAWAMEQVQGVAGALLAGVVINFPEEPETVQEDIREIAPQYLFFGARLWDAYASSVQSKINETVALKRWLYELFLPVGYRVSNSRFQGIKPKFLWRFLWSVGNIMVFWHLRDKLGFSRVRSAYQAGATLSSETFRFFHAIGVNVKQLYGLTESGIITIHRDGDIDPESVGRPVEGGTVRIGENGEVLFKSDRMSDGYYKNPEATKELIDQDGWLHTGDAGYLTDKGHLILYGRLKDVEVLPGGEVFAPEFIEGKLGFSPYIKYAMLVGGGERPYVSAIICIDYENVGDWAEAHRIPYTTYVDLSQKPQVYDLIQKDIERVNQYLSPSTRIRKFVNFHKEFDPDEAELTRTRKLRRRLMEQRYQDLINAIYSDSESYTVEASVKYRDGRTGTIRTTLHIRKVIQEAK